MNIKIDGWARLALGRTTVRLEAVSAGRLVVITFSRDMADTLTAEYFDMLASERDPPPLLSVLGRANQ